MAARTNSREAFKEFARNTNEQNKKVMLRGQLKFKYDPKKAIPLDNLEPALELSNDLLLVLCHLVRLVKKHTKLWNEFYMSSIFLFNTG